MPVSEAKRKANLKYDNENMAYQTVKVNKALLSDFKQAVNENGEKVNTVLRVAMENYVKKWQDNKNKPIKSLAAWSKAVKENACFKCEICGQDGNGSGGRLESHHIISRRDNSDYLYDLKNGVCLCHRCHCLAHGGNFTPKESRPNYIHWEFTQEEIKHAQECIKAIQAKRSSSIESGSKF